MSTARHPIATTRRGGREHRKQVTRRDLLAAGRRLFGERGLYESRIEDLSKQAGVAKGTLYGYFPNKAALIEAVVTAGFSELLGHAHREAQGARTHPEVVARLVEAHLAFFEENPDLLRIFHQVRGLLKFNRPEGLPLRRVLEKYLAGLAHVLAMYRPVGRGREPASLETATILFGAVSGISSTRASLAGYVRRDSRSRATVRALIALVMGFENRAAGRAPTTGERNGASGGARRARARHAPREVHARTRAGSARHPVTRGRA